jgi:effector-binding domain-containing protein
MVEIAGYDVAGHIGEVELRDYPELKLATVTGQGDNSAFRLLFSYISGENRTRKKIPMTAPVITSEKIEMTAPVISNANSFSFVMPLKFKMEEVPEPLESRIKIERIPARRLAVIRFKGYAREKSVNEVKSRLLSTLEKSGIATVGEPFLMRYNSPWTLGFMRRNEVGIETATLANIPNLSNENIVQQSSAYK